MLPPYINIEDLEARVGQAFLFACYSAPDGSDAYDLPRLQRLITDATATVNSHIRGTYHMPVVGAEIPDYLVKLTLDVAQGMMGQQNPETAKYDWADMLGRARDDLRGLAKKEQRLDVTEGPLAAPVNVGGGVRGGFSKGRTPRSPVFLDGTGDYAGDD
ncbi:MAG: phage protein Gp36 family protein [Kofleriaceae bacterium]